MNGQELFIYFFIYLFLDNCVLTIGITVGIITCLFITCLVNEFTSKVTFIILLIEAQIMEGSFFWTFETWLNDFPTLLRKKKVMVP